MRVDPLISGTMSLLVLAVGLLLSIAPLGWSFIVAIVFGGVALTCVLLDPPPRPVPLAWLAPMGLLCAFAILDMLVSLGSATATSAQPLDAAIVLSISILLNGAGLVLGMTAPRAITALVQVYVFVRIATSAFVPWVSVPLRGLLDGWYRYEDYQFAGLGVRYLFPGDIVILAGWLLLMRHPMHASRQRFMRLLLLVAAFATLSRFIVGALLLLEMTRLAGKWLRAGRWGMFAALLTLAMAAMTAWAIFEPGHLAAPGEGIIESRVVAATSNVEKVLQYQMFADAFFGDWGTLLFGAGIGEHLEHYIRDEDHPFQYEAQVPAFAYQLGLLGVGLWIAALLVPFYGVSRALGEDEGGYSRRSLLLLAALLFVAGGFINPFLLLPQNCILFAALGAIYAAAPTGPTTTFDRATAQRLDAT